MVWAWDQHEEGDRQEPSEILAAVWSDVEQKMEVAGPGKR
jgi:hypothetical protein